MQKPSRWSRRLSDHVRRRGIALICFDMLYPCLIPDLSQADTRSQYHVWCDTSYQRQIFLVLWYKDHSPGEPASSSAEGCRHFYFGAFSKCRTESMDTLPCPPVGYAQGVREPGAEQGANKCNWLKYTCRFG